MSILLPADTVRGRIQRYLHPRLARPGKVAEIGSRWPTAEATWADNRKLAPAAESWTGIDFQEGPGVDVVADALAIPETCAALGFHAAFDTVVISEVLEHVKDPFKAMEACWWLLRPSGRVIVTTLTTFPVHGYPDDYWRFTGAGLRLVLERAGFDRVEVETAGRINIELNNRGLETVRREVPIHVFAEGLKCWD